MLIVFILQARSDKLKEQADAVRARGKAARERRAARIATKKEALFGTAEEKTEQQANKEVKA